MVYNRASGWATRAATLALAASLAAGATLAAAQPPEAPLDDPVVGPLHARAMAFFDAVSAGNVASAYNDLLAGSVLLRQTEALKSLTERTQELERFGKFRGAERVDVRAVGKDLLIFRYLYKCDDFPVVWQLVFYRDFKQRDQPIPGNQWVVIVVRFDTDLDLLGL
jgi:hypothetical protein